MNVIDSVQKTYTFLSFRSFKQNSKSSDTKKTTSSLKLRENDTLFYKFRDILNLNRIIETQ